MELLNTKNLVLSWHQSQGKGLIRLKPSKEYKNYRLSTRITGNKLGNQSIYLRADEDLNKYIAVRVKSNVLYIEENGEVIYELDLDKHDGIVPKSLEEDEYLILKEVFKIYEKNSNKKMIQQKWNTKRSRR